MKYYTKSPEEWKEYDEIKNAGKNNKFNNNKKVTVALIIILSLATIGVLFFTNMKSSYDLPNSITIDGINFNLSVDDKIFYPNFLESKVKAQNLMKKEKEIEISEFTYSLINKDNDSVVYNFVQSGSVKDILNNYQIRTLFDVSKETTIQSLKAGNYQIKCNFKFKNKYVTLTKEFIYSHDVDIQIYSEEPFYIIDEKPIIKLYVKNNSSEMLSNEIFGDIEVFKDEKLIFSKNINLGNISTGILEDKRLKIPIDKKFSEGTYKVFFDIKSINKRYFTVFNVVENISKNKNLKINGFTVKYFEKDDSLYYKADLINKEGTEVALLSEKRGFKLYYLNKEIYNYEENTPKRLFIYPEGTSEIFDIQKIKNIALNGYGEYRINFYIFVDNYKYEDVQIVNVRE